MLALSRKQLVLLVVLAVIVTLAASMAVIHAANPILWHHLITDGPVPYVINHF